MGRPPSSPTGRRTVARWLPAKRKKAASLCPPHNDRFHPGAVGRHGGLHSPGSTLLENIEIIQQFLFATTRKDVDGMAALVHDDVEFVPITAAMEGRTYAGQAGVRQFMEDLDDYWEFFETIQEEWHDLGDRVAALGYWHARGRASGAEIHGQPAVWVAYIRDGKIARWRTYTDVAEGLEAAGLSRDQVKFSPT